MNGLRGESSRLVPSAGLRDCMAPPADYSAQEVSLIIPAHRTGEVFGRCLAAVAGLTPAPGEVLVVLSGNAREEAGAVRALGFRAVICMEPLGPGPARNLGAGHASGSWLVFLDSDCIPPAHFLRQAGDALRVLPGANAAFGSYDSQPSAPDFLSRFRNLLHHYTHQRAGAGEGATFWTACGVVRADVFFALGGFQDIPMEDINFGYRLRRTGGKIALDPAWQVKHGKSWRLVEMVKTDVFLRAAPWFRLNRAERREGRAGGVSIRIPGERGLLWAVVDHLRFLPWLASRDGWWRALCCAPCLLLVFCSVLLGWGISWLPVSQQRPASHG